MDKDNLIKELEAKLQFAHDSCKKHALHVKELEKHIHIFLAKKIESKIWNNEPK